MTISSELSRQLRREGARSAMWVTMCAEWENELNIGEVLLRVEEDDAAVLMTREPNAVEDTQGEAASHRPAGSHTLFLAAHGDPHRIVEILEAHLAQLPRPNDALMPREIQSLLTPAVDAWLPAFRGEEWDYFWTDRPLEGREGQDKVELLSLDEARILIPPFLRQANPNTEALDALDAHAWWVIRDEHILAAVGLENRGVASGLRIAHLAGLGTLPEARGQGLASALMTGIVERNLPDYDLIIFGMWAKNARARRVYDALGFVNGGRVLMMSDQPLTQPDLG